jgi:hypothetical protein
MICEKGAIRTALAGIENLPPALSLFEVIDNREHSKSNKFFIDIDSHNKKCIIGFSESATKEQIDSMVMWYNVEKNHYSSQRIASRAAGKKFFDFSVRGDHTYVSKNDNNKYFISSVNTSKIYQAEINPEISNMEFSIILKRETSLAREEDEILQSLSNIFENKDNIYPFAPKTIFYIKNIDNQSILDYFTNKENQDKITKILTIKYYKEILKDNFDLFYKFPNSGSFNKVNTDNSVDVIGITNNSIKQHTTDIYIKDDEYLGYIFKINNSYYKFQKNGTSTLRQKTLIHDCDIELFLNNRKTDKSDFTFIQYNTNEFTKEQMKNSIVGNSLEHYAGLYINIGGVFINSDKVKWNVTDRNLSGSKNYRGVLYINTDNAKADIGLSGLKAQFNLATKDNLHAVIKNLTEVYKKYINSDSSINSDDYVLVKTTAQKTKEEKLLDGHFYLLEIGNNFYKYGFEEKDNDKRTTSYSNKEYLDSIKVEFSEEKIHDNPIIIFKTITKIKNIRAFEQNIKYTINSLDDCQTYDCGIGNNIREYFHCDNIYNNVLPSIINEYRTFIGKSD